MQVECALCLRPLAPLGWGDPSLSAAGPYVLLKALARAHGPKAPKGGKEGKGGHQTHGANLDAVFYLLILTPLLLPADQNS